MIQLKDGYQHISVIVICLFTLFVSHVVKTESGTNCDGFSE